jgi:hypothetical protein
MGDGKSVQRGVEIDPGAADEGGRLMLGDGVPFV